MPSTVVHTELHITGNLFRATRRRLHLDVVDVTSERADVVEVVEDAFCLKLLSTFVPKLIPTRIALLQTVLMDCFLFYVIF